MCLFLRQISCVRRASSRRFFSSVPQSPYLMVSGGFGGSVDTAEGRIVKPRFLDPTKKEKIVCGGEMMIPNERPLFCVGASQGWIMRRGCRNFHRKVGSCARRGNSRRHFFSSNQFLGHIWLPSTYVQQYKRNTSLWVSDLTAVFWCEKQLEYNLLGWQKDSDAMKVGRKGHIQLNKEDAGRPITTEDHWAEKLLSALETLSTFQCFNEARELMIIGSIQGQWVFGKIDQIQFLNQELILTDLKTRGSKDLPHIAQQNKDKFQVMLYMYLFDSLVNQEEFPLEYFFMHHSLNRKKLLSPKVTERVEGLGHVANTLDDLVCLYKKEFRKLKHLMGNVDYYLKIRYECSYKYELEDPIASVYTVDFEYNPELTLENFRTCMEVWNCERNAEFTIHEFKCKYCPYGDSCLGSLKVGIKRENATHLIKKELKNATHLIKKELEVKRQANIAFFGLVSQFKLTLTELLQSEGFVDITSIILGDSRVKQPLCQLQSRHHYKKVAMSTAHLTIEQPRVFWQSSVFTKDLYTFQNACLFTYFDVNMVIQNDYSELMDMVDHLYLPLFSKINEKFSKQIEIIRRHHPFEILKFLPITPRITFAEGVQMLRDVGENVHPLKDLSTESHRILGELILERYDSDFYILHRYPRVVRPFYTTYDSLYGNSFSIFLKGNIILEGHCINDLALLKKQAQWTDLFCNGAPPHGGFKMMLERMVRLFFGLPK